MAILKFNCALALLFVATSACTAAPPAPGAIHIDNALDKCQQITAQSIDLAPIPTLRLDFKSLASTAECGCKSMLNGYSVAIKLDGFTRRVLSGTFKFPKQSPITLPLASQAELIKGQNLEIAIGCEAPL